MANNREIYTETEYQLMLEKLEHLCGEENKKEALGKLSSEIINYAKNNSINIWNEKTSTQFINYIEKVQSHSYCFLLTLESMLKELVISHPQTTFKHISQLFLRYSQNQ